MPSIKPSNPIIDWGNPITKGLVFDAPLSEGVGPVVFNIVNNLRGAFHGTTLPTRSIYGGRSVNFTGTGNTQASSENIDFGNPAYLGLTRSSVEVMINASAHTNNYARIAVAQRTDNVNPYINYGLAFNATNGKVDYNISTGGSGTLSAATSTTALTLGVWYHVVGTYDGANIKIYINGKLEATTAKTGDSNTDNAGFYLGGDGQALSAYEGFKGNMLYARVWKRGITQNEIIKLYTDPWCIYQKPRFNIINSISSAVTGLRGLISFGMIPFGMAETGISATGGTITEVGGYKIHTFTTDGTFEITAGTANVEYLVVAGGGGGGGDSGRGGGGGGGKVKSGTKTALTVGTYTVTVGTGGAGSTTASVKGVNGGDSVFSDVTAKGGGGGGTGPSSKDGATGGNGGGGGDYAGGGTGGSSNDGGYSGGNGLESAPGYGAGGGGGDSANGSNGTSTSGGNGGDGTASTISGSSVTYGGGGGGAAAAGQTAGAGGAGGGGNGVGAGAPTAGTDGLGGGGGGGCDYYAYNGADGGDGVVIVRYAI